MKDDEITVVARETEIRNEGDTESDACHLNEQIITAEFYLREQLKLVLQKQIV